MFQKTIQLFMGLIVVAPLPALAQIGPFSHPAPGQESHGLTGQIPAAAAIRDMDRAFSFNKNLNSADAPFRGAKNPVEILSDPPMNPVAYLHKLRAHDGSPRRLHGFQVREYKSGTPLRGADEFQLRTALWQDPHMQPSQTMFGLGYFRPNWSIEAIGTVVARNEPLQAWLAPSPSAGYATLDVMGGWKMSRNARMDLGVFNLLNRTSFDWGNISERVIYDANARKPKSGRSLGAAINWEW